MYLATRQSVRQPRRRPTLGNWFTDALNWNPWLAPAPSTPPPTVPQLLNPGSPDSIIPLSNPGGGWTDYLLNAVTGQPTSAQLQYNADQYTAAVANMRNVLTSQGVTPPPELDPATAAAQAAADQSAYANLIGGTADQTPFGLSLATWAWIILGGTVGLVVLLDKR